MHFGESTGTREQKEKNICTHAGKTQIKRKRKDCADPMTWHKKQPVNRTVDLVGSVILMMRASKQRLKANLDLNCTNV